MTTVTLRELQDSDLDLIFAWENDAASVQQAAFTRADPSDRAAFDAHYARIRARDDVLLRAVLADGRLAGTVSSFTMDGDREVTYWIDQAQRGLGIATAALTALLELDGVRPVFGRVAEHNAASASVLERCGFRQIGTERSFADGIGREVVERIYRLDSPEKPGGVMTAGPFTA